MITKAEAQEALKEALAGRRSLTDEEAEVSGQPTAWVTICDDPEIGVRVVTKPVVDLPWKRGVEYTYFYGRLFVNGREIKYNGTWAKSPREALEGAIDGWAAHLKADLPYASDLFENCHALYDRNTSGLWLIEGTHEIT